MSRFCYGSCEGWRHYGDPDPDGRASVAGDGPYRHAVWLSEPGSAPAGSAQARRHGRRSFLLQGKRRSRAICKGLARGLQSVDQRVCKSLAAGVEAATTENHEVRPNDQGRSSSIRDCG